MGLLWGVGGLLVGLIAGSLVTWSVMRRGSDHPSDRSSGPSALRGEGVRDREVKEVLDANRRTIAELEDRYRDRKPPKS